MWFSDKIAPVPSRRASAGFFTCFVDIRQLQGSKDPVTSAQQNDCVTVVVGVVRGRLEAVLRAQLEVGAGGGLELRRPRAHLVLLGLAPFAERGDGRLVLRDPGLDRLARGPALRGEVEDRRRPLMDAEISARASIADGTSAREEMAKVEAEARLRVESIEAHGERASRDALNRWEQERRWLQSQVDQIRRDCSAEMARGRAFRRSE